MYVGGGGGGQSKSGLGKSLISNIDNHTSQILRVTICDCFSRSSLSSGCSYCHTVVIFISALSSSIVAIIEGNGNCSFLHPR